MSPLARLRNLSEIWRMGESINPPTLTAEQLRDLNTKLSKMRHSINNQLCLIQAAVEISQLRNELRADAFHALIDPPLKIQAEVADFSRQFEQTLGINRDAS